jgi:hypothetical protein
MKTTTDTATRETAAEKRAKRLERRQMLRDLSRLRAMIERAGQPVSPELDELTSQGWN